jgi:hypothetical protein|tara:strand:+ start:1097 stop:1789 length:693 start_codon:yes stop_codon:yes gene_type:complete
MGLPKLNTPTYELVLPSTEETIKYRPFLVKEQKLLLLAQESENKKEMLDAISQIIENCTFGKINSKEAYVFDVEYVFLQIRRKSIGDKITLNLLCNDDGITRVPTEIDLNDVKVEIGDNHTNKIQLTDDVQLIMTYPRIYTIDSINSDNSYDIVVKCVHQITEGDKIYERVDMSDEDLIEFIESMNTDNLSSVLDFFDTMPKIKHQIKVINPNTNVENTINMEGIESFFT